MISGEAFPAGVLERYPSRLNRRPSFVSILSRRALISAISRSMSGIHAPRLLIRLFYPGLIRLSFGRGEQGRVLLLDPDSATSPPTAGTISFF